MSQPASHGPNVDARTDELGSSEVPEIVKANRGSADLVADPDEERRHVVRSERGRALRERGEHEGICRQLGTGLGNPTLSP